MCSCLCSLGKGWPAEAHQKVLPSNEEAIVNTKGILKFTLSKNPPPSLPESIFISNTMPDCIMNSLGCSSLSQAVKHDEANTRKICIWHQFCSGCACLQARLCFNITSVNAAIVLSSAILTMSAEHG